jgi:hypothetical protein
MNRLPRLSWGCLAALAGTGVAALLVVAVLPLWIAGQLAGVLADHWPPVSYPLGALGELWAVIRHPASNIAPQVPTVGFWVLLLLELAAAIHLAVWIIRRGARHRARPWSPPDATGKPAPAFGDAVDDIAARDSRVPA